MIVVTTVSSLKRKYLDAFMDMTERFAQTSEAQRLKVGAMLLKNGNPIAVGVNGTRAGWHTNVCEDENGNTKPEVRHAEVACLDKLRHIRESATGCTLLVTHSCCLPCAVEVVESGINHVIYRDEYRSSDGLDYLKSKGVTVTKWRSE